MAENKDNQLSIDKAAKALKAAEEALKAAEAHWEAAHENLRDMTCVAMDAQAASQWTGQRPDHEQLQKTKASLRVKREMMEAAEDYFGKTVEQVRVARQAAEAARKAYTAATAV
jgi:hypothetical protein